MIEVRVPDEQEGTKAVVRAWLKQIGEAVAENDPLVELETDKVTQEVPAPAAGVLAEILLDTDAEAVPGALLGRISNSPETVRVEQASSEAETRRRDLSTAHLDKLDERSRRTDATETRLSPSVRRGNIRRTTSRTTACG